MTKLQTNWTCFKIKAIIILFALSLIGLINIEIAYAQGPNIDIIQFASPNPLTEAGGDVTHTYVIENQGTQTITLDSLTHNNFTDFQTNSSCTLTQTIGPGGTYQCQYIESLGQQESPKIITHTVTAIASNSLDSTQTTTEQEDLSFEIEDVEGAISATLRVDRESRNEPGGTFGFTIRIENGSTTDKVTIESVTLLAGSETVDPDVVNSACGISRTVEVGGNLRCAMIKHDMSGVPDDTKRYEVIAEGKDDDGLSIRATASLTVGISDVESNIAVYNTARPIRQPEPGGIVKYEVEVQNTSDTDVITVTALVDDDGTDLSSPEYCNLPITLDFPKDGDSVEEAEDTFDICTYTKTFTGNFGDTKSNTVTATAIDDDGKTIGGNGTANVEITDISSEIGVTKYVQPSTLPEPGGTVTFTVRVENRSFPDIVTLHTLSDTLYGDISALPTKTCQMSQTLAVNGVYTCTYTVEIADKNFGDTIASFIHAYGTDDDGANVENRHSVPINISNIPSSIKLFYDVTPRSVSEGTRNVTFTAEISNTSEVDTVTINTLTDPILGNLHELDECNIPRELAVGESYTCSFVKTITGNAGEVQTYTATAVGKDDDNENVSHSDETNVTFVDVLPVIEVTNDVTPSNPSEPGGDITYTVEISNTSTFDPVDIITLTDSIHGNLHGKGTCSISQTLAVGQSYSCSFVSTITGVVGYQETYTVRADGVDDDNSWDNDEDSDTVTVANVPSEIVVINTITPGSLPEPGGLITYSVEISNLSAVDAVTILTLTDSIYDNLHGQGSCAISQTLAVGERYACEFTKIVTGTVGHQEIYTVTAQGIDDDNVTVNDDHNATVNITDVPSEIVVANNITPGDVPEPGGLITYTVVISNISPVDEVTILTLTDSIYGNLHGQGSCVISQTLAVGQSYTCSFTETVTGNNGYQATHRVTAEGLDDDNKPVERGDDETVTVTDIASSLDMLKTAATPSIDEPGADVVFTLLIANTSPVDNVILEKVEDSEHGDLTAVCLPSGPQTMVPGTAITCTYTRFVGGNAGHVENGTATASGTDDDGQPVSDHNDAPVTIGNVASAIDVTKTANKESVTELGGDVEFVVTVQNVSPVDTVTINELDDSLYGDISSFCVPSLSTPLAPNATVTCTFTQHAIGNSGEDQTGTVTAKGIDDDSDSVQGEDSATVKITDMPASIEVVKSASVSSVDESGENVTFTVVVKNTSKSDSVNLTSVNDPDHGELLPLCTSSTLAPGATMTCTFTEFVAGSPGVVHNTTATAVGTSDDGDPVQGSDDAPVTMTDSPSSIEVVKTASTISVNEGGADVTFTVVVKNRSHSDYVNITSMNDPDHNYLGSLCSPALSQSLAPGATTTCIFTTFVAGDPDDVHNTTVTVAGRDDDGNTVRGNDDAPVTVIDVPSSIEVVKIASAASVGEDGADVTFTVVVRNSSSIDTVQLNTLHDMAYGNISPYCAPALSEALAPGASTTCTFTKFVAGDPGDVQNSVAFAIGIDDDGNEVQDKDDEPVQITDTPASIEVAKSADQTSIPEPGEPVRFTVAVENTSPADHVTINEVVDSAYGDISSSCAPSLVGQTLAPGQIATCSFTEFVSGPVDSSHASEATVSGTGDDDTPVNDSDDITITIYDLPATIDVTKTAMPDMVDESGADVLFTIVVENTSQVDHVTIEQVNDSVYGNISDSCGAGPELAATLEQPASLPITLAPGQTIICSLTELISGNGNGLHKNTAIATGTDDDGNPVSGTDDAQVEIMDLPSSIEVSKSTNKETVIEPGEDVIFTVIVQNTSPADDVTITEVIDSDHGDVSDHCTPALPATLAPGEIVICEFTEFIGGVAGDVLSSSITTSSTDDDGSAVAGNDNVAILVIAPYKPAETPLQSADGAPEVTILTETPTPVNLNPETNSDSTETPTVEPTVVETNLETNPGSTETPTVEPTIVETDPETSPDSTETPTVGSTVVETNPEISPDSTETPTIESTVVEINPEISPDSTETPTVESTVVETNSQTNPDSTETPIVESTTDPTENPAEESTVVGTNPETNPNPAENPTEEATVIAPNPELTPEPIENPPEEPAMVTPNPEPLNDLVPTPTATSVPIFISGTPMTQISTPTATIVAPKVDLAVAIEIAQEQRRDVDPMYVTYRIHYINNGSDAASNTQLMDTLPEGVVYHSNTMPLEFLEMPYLTWNLGTLQPNESGEIYLTVKIMENMLGKELVHKINITCDCTEYDMTNNDDSVSYRVDMPDSVDSTGPTAITLMSLHADPVNVAGGQAIEVRWEIGESFNTRGFDIYRGDTMDPDEAVKLTQNMISVDSAGGLYSFTDETAQPDVSYIYWLFENEYSGEQNIYGPLQESISSNVNAVYLPVVIR